MKLFLFTIVIALTGCTDAFVSNVKAYGEKAKVTCFSGGKNIFEAESTGKVTSLEGGGWKFRTTDNKYIQTFADCFVEVQE